MSERRSARPPRVVGIGGGLRPSSKTRLVLQGTLRALSAQGAQAELLELAETPLPLFSGYRYPAADQQRLAAFRRRVAAAELIVLASPEYHGAVSGALKNALDHLPEGSFRGKLVGLVAVAGGAVSPVATATQLRTISRALGGLVAPCELLVSHSERTVDAEGGLEPSLQGRTAKFVEELLALSSTLKPPTALSELVPT